MKNHLRKKKKKRICHSSTLHLQVPFFPSSDIIPKAFQCFGTYWGTCCNIVHFSREFFPSNKKNAHTKTKQQITHRCLTYMGVSKNRGTPKSSILIGFSIINHPFWGTPIFGNTHMIFRLPLFFFPAGFFRPNLPTKQRWLAGQ